MKINRSLNSSWRRLKKKFPFKSVTTLITKSDRNVKWNVKYTHKFYIISPHRNFEIKKSDKVEIKITFKNNKNFNNLALIENELSIVILFTFDFPSCK